MSYMALYRKFRPDVFEEVKGQDHIVTTLKNQIKHDRIGHAYLFCGTRGTGKTTIAKLLAKAVNCQDPRDGSPCGECESCKSIAAGRALNVIEIDAASNNGVDNIRQINESVQYPPSQGKYLVYIIDEVHMLSTGAFNALLKTLEEPPSYVIFILATTEAHKVPITIKSRCQRFDFHRIPIETIAARLGDLMKREGVSATEDALNYVARAADGSMRDGLSILDECVSFNMGEELTYDRVLKTIGAVDIEVYVKMSEAIAEDDTNLVMTLVNDVVWQGRDLTKFVDDFIWFMRNMLFIKMSPEVAKNLELTQENIEELSKLGEKFSEEEITRYLNILQELSIAIRNSTIKRVTLEMGLIRMMRPETGDSYEDMNLRLDKLEKKTEAMEAKTVTIASNLRNLEENGIRTRSAQKSRMETSDSETDMFEGLSDKEKSDLVKENLKDEFPGAEYEEVEEIARQWRTKILPKIGRPVNIYLERAKIVPLHKNEGEDCCGLGIVLDSTNKKSVEYTYFHTVGEDSKDNLGKLNQEVCEIIQRNIKLTLIEGKTEAEEKRSFAGMDLNKIQFPVEFEED